MNAISAMTTGRGSSPLVDRLALQLCATIAGSRAMPCYEGGAAVIATYLRLRDPQDGQLRSIHPQLFLA